jgi:hypothetical protein
MTTRQSFLIVLVTVAISGCDLLEPKVGCTLIAVPGISVSLVDSLTNSPIPVRAATIVATDGAYADTIFGTALAPDATDTNAGIAYERSGTYTLKVVVAQYREWVKSGIRVTEDQCHVETVSIIARIQRTN